MSLDTFEPSRPRRRRSHSPRGRDTLPLPCSAFCRSIPEAVHCAAGDAGCHQLFAGEVAHAWHLSPEADRHCRSFAQMHALGMDRDRQGVWFLH